VEIERVNAELNQTIGDAERLLINHGVGFLVLCNLPREEEVRIASTLGSRYFDIIHRLDALMSLLQRLVLEALIDESQAQRQRSKAKRTVLAIFAAWRAPFASDVAKR
jgi:hypothetical protein